MSLLTTYDAQTLKFAAVAREHLEKLGRRIRERREELKLSQDDLARRIGLKATGNYVSRWERGENAPGEDYLPLLAKALETTVSDLWSGPVDERRPESDATPDLMGSLNGTGNLAAELHGARQSVAALQEQANEQGAAIRDLDDIIRKQLVPLIARVNAELDARTLAATAATPPKRAPRRSRQASS